MNDSIFTQCGYTRPGEPESRALEKATAGLWRVWLQDCASNGSMAASGEQLRSAMMAVSPVTNSLLAGLGIWQPLDSRIDVMVEYGRPLRSAIATAIRASSSVEQRQAAVEFIRTAFSDPRAKAPEPKAAINFEDKVHRVFASKAAVTFEASTNKARRACLQIEAAPRTTNGDIDWARKIIIQLGEGETLQLLAVLRGWSASMEVAAHGEARDKRMTFSRQTGQPGYLVSVRQASVARVVPIQPFAAYRVIELVMRVLVQNAPNLTHDLILAMAEDLAKQSNHEMQASGSY